MALTRKQNAALRQLKEACNRCHNADLRATLSMGALYVWPAKEAVIGIRMPPNLAEAGVKVESPLVLNASPIS